MFSFDQTSYTFNGKEIEKEDFTINFIQKLKDLTIVSPQVTVDIKDPLDVVGGLDSFNVTKTSREREFMKVANIIRQYFNEFADEYNAESTSETLLFTVDGDIVISAQATVPEEKENGSIETSSKPTVNDEYPEFTPSIPSLNNKQYNEFIKLCNETVSFLEDYGEIGQKREWMLSKTDANNVAKVVFAPLRAWDYVGPECKMTSEDYKLLKSNLVQISIDNACAKLGEHSWNGIFERIKSLKTKWVKFTGTNNSFVAKIKTTVLDKKSKEKLGTVMLTLSITVDTYSDVVADLYKGFLPVFKSNISYNIIAR